MIGQRSCLFQIRMLYPVGIIDGALSAGPLKKGFKVLAAIKKDFIKNYLG
jgi:hypothetical protein